MYTLIRSVTDRYIALQQIISFAISFALAELFYKFHSFALESLAFLATWFVLDFVIGIVIQRVRKLRVAQGAS